MNIARLLLISSFVSFAWYFYQFNHEQNYYILFGYAAAFFCLLYQACTLYRGRAYFGFLRRPFQWPSLRYPLIILLRWCFLALCFLAFREINPVAQSTEADYMRELTLVSLLFCLVALACVVVKKQIDLVFNACLLLASLGLGHELYKAHNPPDIAGSVVLAAPFKTAFSVLSGGESRLHSNAKNRERRSRSYLIHLGVSEDRFLAQPRSQWRDYPNTFGEPIYAPAGGLVLAISNHHADAGFDDIHTQGGPGNFMLVDISGGRFLLLAHLKQGSIRVAPGDTIKAGQLIAQCGKSGQTSEAALALCVFDSPNILDPDTRSFPIYFREVDTIPPSGADGPFFAKRNLRLIPLNALARP